MTPAASRPAAPFHHAPDLLAERAPISIDHTVVVARPEDWRFTGLRFVGSEVEIVESVEDAAGHLDAALLAATAQEVEAFVTQQLREPGAVATIVTPLGAPALAQLLAGFPALAATLTHVRVDDDLACLRLRAVGPGDRDDAAPVALLTAWLADRTDLTGAAEHDHGRAAELLTALLREVDQGQDVLVRPHGHAGRDDAALSRLKREHAKLRKKYEALARSKAGRLTLQYWAWKGRWNESRG